MACYTWNVETTWPDQDLHSLLGVSKGPVIKRGVDAALPDIYIIGYVLLGREFLDRVSTVL